MPRSCTLLVLAALLLLAAAPGTLAQSTPDKTLIIGFDGMDHGLARQFMDQGLLPNFSRLATEGHFGRLETSNPAQSPVSWAVFNTGTNPGKTGVGGFVSRYFTRDKATGQRKGTPLPQPMLGFPSKMAADNVVPFPMALHEPQKFVAMAAGAAFLLVAVLLKLVGVKLLLAVLLALAAGAGGWYLALDHVATLPADGEVPYEVNPMQGTNFWTHLDEAGIRMMGVQAASTSPPDDEGPNTLLLSGLGVKDVSGSPGSWFVFTDDPWAWEDDTNAGGKIKKIYFDQDGETRALADLPGPTNWIVEARFQADIAALEKAVNDPGNTEEEARAFEEEKRDVTSSYNKWKKGKAVLVPFDLVADREAGTLTVSLQGRTATVAAGGWSDFMPVEFRFNSRFAAHGIARFHVIRCDAEEVRVYVPPINIDPAQPPEWLPISSPPGFCSEIAAGIGRGYETLGWACMTNALKDHADTHFSPQGFIDDIAFTMAGREAILGWAMSQSARWDVYYQVFGTTDRVAHMLFREFDPDHPGHDAAYADQQMSAWGRTFRLGNAVPEIYREADRIIGGLLARMDSGELGQNPLLMVVSDHGFTSFRRGVNLNNLLYELGYLKTKGDKPLSEFSGQSGDLLMFADWERTRAYSMGLGKVFINLKGREPLGIVEPADYESLMASLQADLLAVTDGPGGPKVLTSLARRDELFDGPWWKEGSGVRRKAGVLEDVEHDGFADLFAGYGPYYRVNWANTMGGLDKAAVLDNLNHWSGDHVSVDPQHVPGILFSNRKLDGDGQASLMDVGPTVLNHYGIDLSALDLDGNPLPFAAARAR